VPREESSLTLGAHLNQSSPDHHLHSHWVWVLNCLIHFSFYFSSSSGVLCPFVFILIKSLIIIIPFNPYVSPCWAFLTVIAFTWGADCSIDNYLEVLLSCWEVFIRPFEREKPFSDSVVAWGFLLMGEFGESFIPGKEPNHAGYSVLFWGAHTAILEVSSSFM